MWPEAWLPWTPEDDGCFSVVFDCPVGLDKSVHISVGLIGHMAMLKLQELQKKKGELGIVWYNTEPYISLYMALVQQ